MIVPVDAKRKDWPRLVAQAIQQTDNKVEARVPSRAKLRFVS